MALKINKVEKETPLHPNVLLAQIEELEGDCVKIIKIIWIYYYKQTQQN